MFSALGEDELEPARKKRREQLAYLESEEFQKILQAKSKHTHIVKEVRAQKTWDVTPLEPDVLCFFNIVLLGLLGRAGTFLMNF
jgi:hypothetical protein